MYVYRSCLIKRTIIASYETFIKMFINNPSTIIVLVFMAQWLKKKRWNLTKNY